MEEHAAGTTDVTAVLPPALTALEHSSMRVRLDKWAVSSETSMIADFYAWVVSEGTMDFEGLREQVKRGRLGGIDPMQLGRMARMLAIQLGDPQYDDFVLAALRLVLRHDIASAGVQRLRKLQVEMLFERGEYKRVRDILSRDAELANERWGYLTADSLNPYVLGPGADHDTWLESFNRPFTSYGLVPVQVDPGAVKPFDTLAAPVKAIREGGPLVSVIVTTYNPDPAEIATAVRSVLNQTWRNLEILLIDDCSQNTAPEVLEGLVAMDERIRLIRLESNGGTYRARNVGIAAARGVFVTGQDTDDWSHPERIARQVDRLIKRQDIAGVMTRATRVNDDMVRVSRGLFPERRCEVSFMMRRADAIRVGGYLPVRKAGDSEFRERLEQWTGMDTDVLEEPLYMIRLSSGSLSRSDFRPGWNHPMRQGFRNAYRHWHETATQRELAVDNLADEDVFPFAVAPNMRGKEYEPQHYDVCFVADWRSYSPQVRSALDEMRVCLEGGLSVAVLHLESPYGRLKYGTPTVRQLQGLINAGEIGQVYAHGPDSVRVTIVRDPAVIHLGRRAPLGISTDRVLMVAEPEEMQLSGRSWTYDPAYAHAMAMEMFESDVQWVLTATEDRTAADPGADVPLAQWSYPFVVAGHWSSHPPRITQSVPAVVACRVGPSPGDSSSGSQRTVADILTDCSADVRWLGDARVLLDQLGRNTLPASWVCFGEDEIDPLLFWRVAGFSVLFGTGSGVAERDVLEALAAGVIVMGDRQLREVYGGHIVAANPTSVTGAIDKLSADPDRCLRLATAAQQYVRTRYGGEPLVQVLKEYVGSEEGIKK